MSVAVVVAVFAAVIVVSTVGFTPFVAALPLAPFAAHITATEDMIMDTTATDMGMRVGSKGYTGVPFTSAIEPVTVKILARRSGEVERVCTSSVGNPSVSALVPYTFACCCDAHSESAPGHERRFRRAVTAAACPQRPDLLRFRVGPISLQNDFEHPRGHCFKVSGQNAMFQNGGTLFVGGDEGGA